MELLAQYGADVDNGLQSGVMFDQIDIVRLKLLEEAWATIDGRPRHETHPLDYKTEAGVRVRIH